MEKENNYMNNYYKLLVSKILPKMEPSEQEILKMVYELENDIIDNLLSELVIYK